MSVKSIKCLTFNVTGNTKVCKLKINLDIFTTGLFAMIYIF